MEDQLNKEKAQMDTIAQNFSRDEKLKGVQAGLFEKQVSSNAIIKK